ncbi:MAG: hypothetical protein JO040_03885 [Gemmatimonadetes bacterium]|nr:hypothetical protein [Gemmatimonadota bacterium]
MYAIGYRYPVPPSSASALVELQQRVARLYGEAGCRRYLLLRPRAEGEPWTELTFYDDRRHYEEVERKLGASSTLEVLFAEFLRLTGVPETELEPMEFDVAFQSGTG